MILLDGKEYRNELTEEYKKEIIDNKLNIGLAIIQVGDVPESNIYVRNKINFCKKVGVETYLYKLDNPSEEELIYLIKELNNNDSITGIILQSPTYGIDFDKCVEEIDTRKDVDGLTSSNTYKIYRNEKDAILPCTVKGIIKLLEHYNIDLEGKNVTILGRGELVGKPLALALTNLNCTVTLCHSKSKKVKEHVRGADIVVGAMGNPHYITKDMLREGFIGVDAGTTFVDGKQVGDFDFDNVKEYASFITPPVGGVGPMTVSMIVDNLIEMKKKVLIKK